MIVPFKSDRTEAALAEPGMKKPGKHKLNRVSHALAVFFTRPQADFQIGAIDRQ
jgi:hypothetical protein